MKNLNTVLFAAALIATISLAPNAGAQQYRPTGKDGITTSPKLRQMLEQSRVAPGVAPASPSITVTYRNPAVGVTASPKLSQMFSEQKVVVSGVSSTEVASAGYRPTGTDGVTASPKLRQQLGDRGPAFMIAPLK